MAAMVVMEAMVDTDMARGPLTPMPTTAMAVMEAMAVMALALTDTARGPLMLMPTTAMAAMEDMVVMAAMADTDMVRGPLMPMPTTDMVVMPVTAVAMDMAMASNSNMAAIISELSSSFYATQNPDKLRKNYCYLIYKLINFN